MELHQDSDIDTLIDTQLAVMGDKRPYTYRVRKPAPKSCSVEGCERNDKIRLGYCVMHYTRIRQNGTTELLRPEQKRRPPPRPLTENPVYSALHSRLRRLRGAVADEQCVDCGGPAQEWSYDHTDPDERTDPNTRFSYSVDLDRYEPRCKPCHGTFDKHKATP